MVAIDRSSDWSDSDLYTLAQIASYVGVDTQWLLDVIWLESGCRATAVNAASGAAGLIQWIPAHYLRWGTRGDLISRGVTGQLAAVRDWLGPYRARLPSRAHLYLAIFWPAAVPHAHIREYVIAPAGSSIAKANPTLCGPDGSITVASCDAAIDDAHTPETSRYYQLRTRLMGVATQKAPVATWRDLQRVLTSRGLYAGPIDGIPGPLTLTAITRLIAQ